MLETVFIFRSITYNRAIVYKRQNVLAVVVHVIINDQCNQTAQVKAIYSRAVLVSVKSECRVKRSICKTRTGTLANSADPDQTPKDEASYQGLHCLLKLQNIKVQMKHLWVPVQDHFPSLHSETIDPPVLSALWFITFIFELSIENVIEYFWQVRVQLYLEWNHTTFVLFSLHPPHGSKQTIIQIT